MANKPRAKGTSGENEIVTLLSRWFKCERRALHGTKDTGDIAGTPYVVSVKRCENWPVHKWLTDLHKMRRNANDEPGFILARRNRSEWVAIMPVAVLSELLDQIHGGTDG